MTSKDWKMNAYTSPNRTIDDVLMSSIVVVSAVLMADTKIVYAGELLTQQFKELKWLGLRLLRYLQKGMCLQPSNLNYPNPYLYRNAFRALWIQKQGSIRYLATLHITCP
jgi:hypothetical protein